MRFEELAILLPCHSLEDFPLHHEGEQAEGLLAAWSAMWHPRFLASAERLPTWHRADGPPEPKPDRLLVIPTASESLLMTGWPARAKDAGACVVRKRTKRQEIVDEALASLDPIEGSLNPELAADFLALGTTYLHVELLTRQMRYMSTLDEAHIKKQVVGAAQAAVAGRDDEARQLLRNCFEVLIEARERFYATEIYLIDLVLVAATTLGDSLRTELAREAPINLLLSGETLDEMAAREPATLVALKSAVAAGRATIVGGEYHEGELPLLPIEAILRELELGGAAYREHLGTAPVVFGRRRFGPAVFLPSLLGRMGFVGALHMALDDGQFPKGEQAKTRWEGLDGASIDTLTRLPLDAAKSESFLGLPTKLSQSLDHDHVATLLFARWPGQASAFYDDLRRVASYTPVLGRFVTLTDYFQEGGQAGGTARFTADEYRAPYLKQAIVRQQADPVSGIAASHKREAIERSGRTLDAMASLLGATVPPGGASPPEVETLVTEAAERFAGVLPRDDRPASPAYLVVNPLSFSRRVAVEVADLTSPPSQGGAIDAVQFNDQRRCVLVDVPPLGFAWIGNGDGPSRKAKSERLMAEDNVLRNEHFEVVIHPQSGGIQSIHDFKRRQNRLSQQLAFRLPGPRPKPGDVWRDPDQGATYTQMVSRQIEVKSAGPAVGEIFSRGELQDDAGRRIAGFSQTVRVLRGSPVLRVRIELDSAEEPRADPWTSYYCCRFAWSDEAAELKRSVGLAGLPTEAKRIEAPLYVEIAGGDFRTTILTDGLPYHRRSGLRMLDTLLIARGDTARVFELGIGIDLTYPFHAALDLLAPSPIISGSSRPPRPETSGWLFHLDAKNVVATHLSPLLADGKPIGFRIRLVETEGRAAACSLRAFRAASRARQTDFRGQVLAELAVEDDRIKFDVIPFEWVQIEATW